MQALGRIRNIPGGLSQLLRGHDFGHSTFYPSSAEFTGLAAWHSSQCPQVATDEGLSSVQHRHHDYAGAYGHESPIANMSAPTTTTKESQPDQLLAMQVFEGGLRS